MDGELRKPRGRRKPGPDLARMTFRWRIGQYRKHGRDESKESTFKQQQGLYTRSPLQSSRLRDDSLRLDPLNSLPIEADRPVQHIVDYCKSLTSRDNTILLER